MKYRAKIDHRHFSRSRAALIATAVALALLSWGCDSSNSNFIDSRTGESENESDDTGSQQDDTPPEVESGTDDAGHGPDEDQQLIDAGSMTGSWRVANAQDQALIANLDLFQEEQDSALEGYFSMGLGIPTGVDGTSGEILPESSYDGQTLLVKWNPTDVETEVYTVTAQKEDDDTFTGKFTAHNTATLEREVIITRYPFGGPTNPESDAGGETAGDIDAGSQGGAGGSQVDAGP